MTIRDSATGQRTTLLRVAAATWLLLVSAVVLVDHMALSGLAEQTQAFAPTAQVSLLESRVDGLSHRVEQRHSQPAALPQARYEQDTAAFGPAAGGDRAGAGPIRRHRCAARIGNPRHATGSPPGLAPAQAARTTAIPTCGGPTQAC